MTEPDISCKYSQLSPLINASGCQCATKTMLDTLLDAPGLGTIMTKSATLEPRPGNPEPRYWEDPVGQFTINAMGLPNCGLAYYLDYYKNLGDSWSQTRFISIAGLTLEENLAMLELLFNPASSYYIFIEVLEINLSCPNIVGGHGLAGYDLDNLGQYLYTLLAKFYDLEQASSSSNNIRVGLKLPPYYEFSQFDRIVNILKIHNSLTGMATPVSFIHTINSIPNGLVIDAETESPVIKPKSGFGGLGGSIVKPVALANVRAFYTRFKSATLSIDIIGSGGVSSGMDIFEFILAGAEMVSVGSQLMLEGPGCFARMLVELSEIMKKKCYAKLDDFRGKLRLMCQEFGE